jgi:hypothetical protein
LQTFLPLTTNDFASIAKTLDNRRLNKQALEGWQILMTLVELDPQGNDRKPKGWVNHPAVKMWRGYETALFHYIIAMTEEWEMRGFRTTIGDKARDTYHKAADLGRIGAYKFPEWLTDEATFAEITATHRQALLVKEYSWYHQFGWPEDTGVAPTEYTYIWPV